LSRVEREREKSDDRTQENPNQKSKKNEQHNRRRNSNGRRWLSSEIFGEKICVEGRIERGLITNLLAHNSIQFRSENRVEEG
jgi:hypothetical protein